MIIKVKFENKNVLILDKPWGLVVTNEGRNEQNSVETYLSGKYDWAKKIDRSGIVHRLDKGTSGLLMVAKNEKYLKYLKKMFKDRLVYKEYEALIGRDVSFVGEIKAPLIRKKYGVWGKRQVGIGGKEAWTVFELIKKYSYQGKKYCLVKIVLKTGRTHQIRAHFSYLGWPLVGDRQYGGEMKLINRPFLHAKILEFVDMDKKNVKVESEMAYDLSKVLGELEKNK